MEYLAFAFIVIYVCCMLWLVIGIKKLPTFTSKKLQVATAFSIIIPFRNEEASLPALLESLKALTYPKDLFEVLLVDDSSTDDSLSVVNAFSEKNPALHIRVLANERHSPSPKKDAIQTAIDLAQYPWILTTDADCIVPQTWLTAFDAFIQQQHPKMIAGPVAYVESTGFLHHFQQLDLLSLQGASIGSFGQQQPLFCNGANLAYEKTAFQAVGGFEGNREIASGDDVFLLEKFRVQYSNQVKYLKSTEAVVHTHSEPNWRALWQQRIRWAAKSTAYKNALTKLLGLVVFLGNLSLVILLILGLLNIGDPQWFFWAFLVKFNIDLLLIYLSSQFFQQSIRYYLMSSLLYPFFSTAVAFSSVFGGYRWKGRTFKR